MIDDKRTADGTYVFHITGINPEPWTAPEHSIGRKNGKMFVQVYSSDTLRSYKQAVAEEFRQQNGWWTKPLDGDLTAEFFFWRRMDQSEAEDRRRTRNWVDSTNCLKSTEDALQKILYVNDARNRLVLGHMVEQGPDVMPHIAVRIRPYGTYTLLGAPPSLPTYAPQPKNSNARTYDDGEPF